MQESTLRFYAKGSLERIYGFASTLELETWEGHFPACSAALLLQLPLLL